MAAEAELLAAASDVWLENYFVNNVYNGVPVFMWMESNGSVTESGGNNIVVGVNKGRVSTKQDARVLDSTTAYTRPADTHLSAKYDWAAGLVPIFWDQKEQVIVGGEAQRIDLINARFMEAGDEARTICEELILGDGGTNTMNGLGNIVATQKNSVGGIDATKDGDADWWRPQFTTYGGQTLSTYKLTYTQAATAIQKLKFGGAYMPKLGITRQKLFVQLRALAQGNQRFVTQRMASEGGTAVIGFDDVVVDDVPILFPDEDTAKTAGMGEDEIWFVNSNYLRFYKHSQFWMNRADPIRVPGTNTYETNITFVGNLAATARRNHGVLKYTT